MITADGKLEIFEHFRVDRDLPKHKKQRRKSRAVGDEDGAISDSDMMVGLSNGTVMFDQDDLIGGDFIMGENLSVMPRRKRRRGIWGKFLRLFAHERRTTAVGLDRFFRSLKDSREQVELVEHRTVGYARAIDRARERGQQALLEQLVAGLGAVRAETQLVAMGLPTYVTEETVVRFARKVDRGLRLDWLANFTRMIPDEVAAKKAEADQRCIFDNYVVLHFDRAGDSALMTKEEKRRAKDPILFGMIAGSDKLYFVADWVDEYCDLTLDKMLKVIGKDVLKLNGESLKKRIISITA